MTFHLNCVRIMDFIERLYFRPVFFSFSFILIYTFSQWLSFYYKRLCNVCCGSSRVIPLHGDHTINTIYNMYVKSTLYLSNPPYIFQIVLFSAQNGTLFSKFQELLWRLGFVCLFAWWRLAPLTTIFQLYIVAESFIDGGNPEKITDPPQITDKLYHIMLSRVHLALIEIRTHNISDDRHWLHR